MAVSPNDGSITSAELHTSSGLERPIVISLGNVKRPKAISIPCVPQLVHE
jgi:hypothetical protein